MHMSTYICTYVHVHTRLSGCPVKAVRLPSHTHQSFRIFAAFSASAATSDPVVNDGSFSVALTAARIKEELDGSEEHAISPVQNTSIN